jgi:lipopolysaccharide assembly outer membrane protein LptD (OstA)
MKRSLAALAVCTLTLAAQDYPAGEMKRLSVPTTTSLTPLSVAAREIEREGLYPSVIHLKGSVEIKTPVCVKAGQGSVLNCDGYVVLRADTADFHEGTGQIEARGNVTVTREE